MPTMTPSDMPTQYEQQMQTTAEEYVALRLRLHKIEEDIMRMRSDAAWIAQHCRNRKADLAKYVGPNVSSRCIRTSGGDTVIVHITLGSALTCRKDLVDIEIFSVNGEPVRSLDV